MIKFTDFLKIDLHIHAKTELNINNPILISITDYGD